MLFRHAGPIRQQVQHVLQSARRPGRCPWRGVSRSAAAVRAFPAGLRMAAVSGGAGRALRGGPCGGRAQRLLRATRVCRGE